MKLKLNKSVIAGLFLIILTAGSTVAYGVLQSLTSPQGNAAQGNAEQTIELPEQNIIDYRLSTDQQRYLLRYGKTIVEFEYSLACEACRDTKVQLEAAASEFSDQLMLVELVVGDSEDLPTVRMESSYGRQILSKPTVEELMNSFCDLFANPPLRCATRNV